MPLYMSWSRWLADRFRSGKARAVAAREAVARREREFAALTAVAAIIGRRADLAVTAEEMLGVVRGLTGMAGGAVYRFEPATRTLVLVAQSGLAPNELDRFRVRPVEGTHIGAALLAGEFRVVAIDEFESDHVYSSRTESYEPEVELKIRGGARSVMLLECWSYCFSTSSSCGVGNVLSGRCKRSVSNQRLLHQA